MIVNRLEYKYLVPIEKLSELRSELSPFLEVDPYAARTGIDQYTVRSIYYDTTDFRYYNEKIEGEGLRKKVRIRSYNQLYKDSLMFLEIKRKTQKTIRKNRAAIFYYDFEDVFFHKQLKNKIVHLGKNGSAFSDAIKFFYQIYRENLRPTILVTYEREAYYHKFNHLLRLTFDYNLRSSFTTGIYELFSEENMLPSLQDYFILEIKFISSLPRWLNHTIARYGLKQQALSKYTICLDDQFKYRLGVMNPRGRKIYFYDRIELNK